MGKSDTEITSMRPREEQRKEKHVEVAPDDDGMRSCLACSWFSCLELREKEPVYQPVSDQPKQQTRFNDPTIVCKVAKVDDSMSRWLLTAALVFVFLTWIAWLLDNKWHR